MNNTKKHSSPSLLINSDSMTEKCANQMMDNKCSIDADTQNEINLMAEDGVNQAFIAQQLSVSRAAVSRCIQTKKTTDEVMSSTATSPRYRRGRGRKKRRKLSGTSSNSDSVKTSTSPQKRKVTSTIGKASNKRGRMRQEEKDNSLLKIFGIEKHVKITLQNLTQLQIQKLSSSSPSVTTASTTTPLLSKAATTISTTSTVNTTKTSTAISSTSSASTSTPLTTTVYISTSPTKSLTTTTPSSPPPIKSTTLTSISPPTPKQQTNKRKMKESNLKVKKMKEPMVVLNALSVMSDCFGPSLKFSLPSTTIDKKTISEANYSKITTKNESNTENDDSENAQRSSKSIKRKADKLSTDSEDENISLLSFSHKMKSNDKFESLFGEKVVAEPPESKKEGSTTTTTTTNTTTTLPAVKKTSHRDSEVDMDLTSDESNQEEIFHNIEKILGTIMEDEKPGTQQDGEKGKEGPKKDEIKKSQEKGETRKLKEKEEMRKLKEKEETRKLKEKEETRKLKEKEESKKLKEKEEMRKLKEKEETKKLKEVRKRPELFKLEKEKKEENVKETSIMKKNELRSIMKPKEKDKKKETIKINKNEPPKDKKKELTLDINKEADTKKIGKNETKDIPTKKVSFKTETVDDKAIGIPNYAILDIEKLKVGFKNLSCSNCYQRVDVKFPNEIEVSDTEFQVDCITCNHLKTFTRSRSSVDVLSTTANGHDSLYARLVFSSLDFGGGFRQMESMCLSLGIPQLDLKSYKKNCDFIIHQSKLKVEKFLQNAGCTVFEVYKNNGTEPDEKGVINVNVTYDGTWIKKNKNARYGLIVAIDMVTGLILDYHLMSKFCWECVQATKRNSKDLQEWRMKHKDSGQCRRNYESTPDDMELDGALILCHRSVQKHKLRYNKLASQVAREKNSEGLRLAVKNISNAQEAEREWNEEKTECKLGFSSNTTSNQESKGESRDESPKHDDLPNVGIFTPTDDVLTDQEAVGHDPNDIVRCSNDPQMETDSLKSDQGNKSDRSNILDETHELGIIENVESQSSIIASEETSIPFSNLAQETPGCSEGMEDEGIDARNLDFTTLPPQTMENEIKRSATTLAENDDGDAVASESIGGREGETAMDASNDDYIEGHTLTNSEDEKQVVVTSTVRDVNLNTSVTVTTTTATDAATTTTTVMSVSISNSTDMDVTEIQEERPRTSEKDTECSGLSVIKKNVDDDLKNSGSINGSEEEQKSELKPSETTKDAVSDVDIADKKNCDIISEIKSFVSYVQMSETMGGVTQDLNNSLPNLKHSSTTISKDVVETQKDKEVNTNQTVRENSSHEDVPTSVNDKNEESVKGTVTAPELPQANEIDSAMGVSSQASEQEDQAAKMPMEEVQEEKFNKSEAEKTPLSSDDLKEVPQSTKIKTTIENTIQPTKEPDQSTNTPMEGVEEEKQKLTHHKEENETETHLKQTEENKSEAHPKQTEENKTEAHPKQTSAENETEKPLKQTSAENETEKHFKQTSKENVTEKHLEQTSKENVTEKHIKQTSKENETEEHIKQTSKENETEEHLKQTSKENETEEHLKQTSKENETETHPKQTSAENVTEKHLKQTSAENETEKHLKPISKENETEKHLKQTSAENETEKNLKQTSAENETEKHLKPISKDNETEKHLKQISKENETEKHLKQTSAENETEKNLKQTSAENETEKHLKPISKDNETEKHLKQTSAENETEKHLKQISKENETETHLKQTSKENERESNQEDKAHESMDDNTELEPKEEDKGAVNKMKDVQDALKRIKKETLRSLVWKKCNKAQSVPWECLQFACHYAVIAHNISIQNLIKCKQF